MVTDIGIATSILTMLHHDPSLEYSLGSIPDTGPVDDDRGLVAGLCISKPNASLSTITATTIPPAPKQTNHIGRKKSSKSVPDRVVQREG